MNQEHRPVKEIMEEVMEEKKTQDHVRKRTPVFKGPHKPFNKTLQQTITERRVAVETSTSQAGDHLFNHNNNVTKKTFRNCGII